MWKFLSGLINSFLLLRDIFGYAGPGAIFLGLVVFHFRSLWYQQYLTDHEQIAPFWFFAIAFLLVSYVAGNGLAALGYSLLDVARRLSKRKKADTPAATGQPVDDEERTILAQIYPQEQLATLYAASAQHADKNPDDKSKKEEQEEADERQKQLKEKKLRILQNGARLYYQHLYPQLFIDADRRGVINIMRISLGAGLTAGGVLLFVPVPGVDYSFSLNFLIAELLKIVLVGCGVFMLWNGHTGQRHVAEYYSATLKAALRAQEDGVPIFRWDECCDKKAGKDDSDDNKAAKKG